MHLWCLYSASLEKETKKSDQQDATLELRHYLKNYGDLFGGFIEKYVQNNPQENHCLWTAAKNVLEAVPLNKILKKV